MDYAAWVGLAVTVIGGFGALAYRSDRKWRYFFAGSSGALAYVFTLFACASVGLFYALILPQKVKQMLFISASVAVIAGGMFLLLLFANWLREP